MGERLSFAFPTHALVPFRALLDFHLGYDRLCGICAPFFVLILIATSYYWPFALKWVVVVSASVIILRPGGYHTGSFVRLNTDGWSLVNHKSAFSVLGPFHGLVTGTTGRRLGAPLESPALAASNVDPACCLPKRVHLVSRIREVVSVW